MSTSVHWWVLDADELQLKLQLASYPNLAEGVGTRVAETGYTGEIRLSRPNCRAV